MYFVREQKTTTISANRDAAVFYPPTPSVIPTSPKHTIITVLLEKLTACQLVKNPFILCSPQVHYRVHNSPSLFINPRQNNPVHAYHPLPVSSTSILSSNQHLSLSCVFASGFRHQTSVRISPMRATCPAQPLLPL